MITLTDGQVLDYTKSEVPYTDERFLESNAKPAEAPVATQLTAGVEDLASMEERENEMIPVEQFRAQIPPEVATSVFKSMSAAKPTATQTVWITDRTVPTKNPELTAPVEVAPRPHIGDVFPQPQPFVPLLIVEQPKIADVPLYVTSDTISKVFAAVQARVEALESLDEQNGEIKATIKALKWVLDTIAKKSTYCATSSGK